jgi:adenylosuccinate synthase
MGKGKLAVLVGGQYGSEGKGAIAAHIANNYGVHIRVGSPNAGHTIYWKDAKHVMQSIPCGWINPNARIVIGRGALLNMKQFMKELVHILQYYPNFLDRLFIDAEAGILDEKFHIEEGGTQGEMHKRIGSTGEGVGPARIARIKRDKNEFHQFKDVADEYGLLRCMYTNTPAMIAGWQDNGINILIEGTQGSGLSLLHSYYPYCTSIDTNAAGIISEVGIAPSRVTDVIMVCRTYPIRVAGNSGPMENEITWDELNKRMGVIITPEKTTVTKKIRRIAEWDDVLFEQSCLLNAPTEIALTFADYIDPTLFKYSDANIVGKSAPLSLFIENHLRSVKDKIRYVSTGPDTVAEIQEGTWQ